MHGKKLKKSTNNAKKFIRKRKWMEIDKDTKSTLFSTDIKIENI